jgi:hypothetical protein
MTAARRSAATQKLQKYTTEHESSSIFINMLARSLATEDPSKKNLFSNNRQEKRAFLKQPIRFLYRLLQCCEKQFKNYF